MIKIRIGKPTRCNSDKSLYISFDFDNHILELVRSYSIRYFNYNGKEWELPITYLDSITQTFKDYKTSITEEEFEEEKDIDTSDFKFKTKPFSHQIEGFDYGMRHKKWFLGDEQGLGKTKQAIDISVAKKQKIKYKHCLIICGVNQLKWNWQNEVFTHSNEKAWVLGQRTKNGKTSVPGNKEKLEDLQNISKLKDYYFLITNIESLRYTNEHFDFKKKKNIVESPIVNEIINLCKQGIINIIVTDEIHKMKDPDSKQGKAFLKLQAEEMIAMTGTPVMNSPLDLYIIFKWLGYEDHSFYAFKNHYSVMGGFGGHDVIGYRNLGEMQEKLNNIMLRRLKEDVLDLPEKIFVNEYLDMTPKQEVVYKEIRNDLRANIDKINENLSPLAEMIRLRQATGYTGILSTKVMESAKLNRMEEIIDESIQNGRKVVVFSQWTSITDEVIKRLSKYKPLAITGQTSDSDRSEQVKKFQEDEDSKVIVGTVGAMGTGITLTAGTIEIFLDEPWNDAIKSQAVDRCHRVGTKENITIYTLMCKNTIDEWIHEIVYDKKQLSDMVVDGKQLGGSHRDLVEYLLH